MPLRLRGGAWPAFTAVIVWFALAFVAPLAGLAVSVPWADVAAAPPAIRSLVNTLGLAALGGVLTLALYALGALAISRMPERPRAGALGLAFVPAAMPGIVIGLAVAWLFAAADVPPGFAGVWIATTIAFAPAGLVLAVWAFESIDPDARAAARLAGAGGWRAISGVTLPPMRRLLAAGWLAMVIVFVRDTAVGPFPAEPGNALSGPSLLALWSGGEAAAAATIALAVVSTTVLLAIAFAMTARTRARAHG
jgi:iron(III) transport system permease protein